MILNNKYGYKVCFKGIKKIRYITNTYDLALFTTQMRDNKKFEFEIYPVKNKREYKKLWKGCPF